MSRRPKDSFQPSSVRKPHAVLAPATADADCIRVRLDHRTIVLLKSMKSFASWKARYPAAEVIEVVPAPAVRKAKGA